MNIKEDAPGSIVVNSNRVILMRDRFDSIKNNYAGMLYFCQRITGVDKVSMTDLSNFEFARFHTNEAFKKNMSFPVHSYLEKIEELEKEIVKLQAKV